jgi:hypothetical protein
MWAISVRFVHITQKKRVLISQTSRFGAENENRTFGFNPIYISAFGCFSNSEVTHKESASRIRLHFRATSTKIIPFSHSSKEIPKMPLWTDLFFNRKSVQSGNLCDMH